jgi:hypothetical protein
MNWNFNIFRNEFFPNEPETLKCGYLPIFYLIENIRLKIFENIFWKTLVEFPKIMKRGNKRTKFQILLPLLNSSFWRIFNKKRA